MMLAEDMKMDSHTKAMIIRCENLVKKHRQIQANIEAEANIKPQEQRLNRNSVNNHFQREVPIWKQIQQFEAKLEAVGTINDLFNGKKLSIMGQ